MKYTVFYENPPLRFLKIRAEIPVPKLKKQLEVQLPSWRPGRYELGNFAKNLVSFVVKNDKNKALPFKKITKDRWIIEVEKSAKIIVDYVYFSAELNAGSTYLSEHQLYINPVNCLIYVDDYLNQQHSLELRVPKHFVIACGLPKKGQTLTAKNYHELADSPLIAKPELKHHRFVVQKTPINIWFSGTCSPDLKKIESDFKAFIEVQLAIFKTFPFQEYHFLFQYLDKYYYHGVEHQNSTVIVLGPGSTMMEQSSYEDFMGISSHEFFHAWNIKAIRPIEMFPYNYTRENYSPLGYVAEGVTTYYGDVCLMRSKYFKEEQYFAMLADSYSKYMENEGRKNMSVAEASIDTWLDGYTKGVPNRKVSIYNEGSMIAFITDTLIRKASKNKFSLDNVMRDLFEKFALKNKGYSEKDYWNLVYDKGVQNTQDILDKYIWGKNSYEFIFESALAYYGLELIQSYSEKVAERRLGLKLSDNGVVQNIAVDSPAWKSGITYGDTIISIEGIDVKLNAVSLEKWLSFYSQQRLVKVGVMRNDKVLDLSMILDNMTYFSSYQIRKNPNMSKMQQLNLKNWLWS